MAKIVEFPFKGSDFGQHHDGDVRTKLLTESAAHAHAIQFYEDEPFLIDTVASFFAAGVDRGDRMIAVVTDEHRATLVPRLEELGVGKAIATGQIAFASASQSLSQFMVGGMPDTDRFLHFVNPWLAEGLSSGHRRGRTRAFGEMVNVLWRHGNSHAAIRLEELWSDVIAAHDLSMLCAYGMGDFYREGDTERFLEVCSKHDHVFPAESFTGLTDSEARGREVSILQQRSHALDDEIRQRRLLEAALRDALIGRARVEEALRLSLARDQEWRARAEDDATLRELLTEIGVVPRR